MAKLTFTRQQQKQTNNTPQVATKTIRTESTRLKDIATGINKGDSLVSRPLEFGIEMPEYYLTTVFLPLMI